MRGLGRLLALPFLLMALAVQSLAPAEAAVMRVDASVFGVCSAHELGGQRPDPAKPHEHDCCAFACVLANLGAAPPAPIAATPVAFAVLARPATPERARSPRVVRLGQPRARGPPAPGLTT